MGRIKCNPDFLEFHSERMTVQDIKEVGDAAAALKAIASKVGADSSLSKYEFVSNINEVERHLQFDIEMLEKCSNTLRKAAELYTRYENKALLSFEGKELGWDAPLKLGSEGDWIDDWCGDTEGTIACSLAGGKKEDDGQGYFGYEGEYGLLELKGDKDASVGDYKANAAFEDEASLGRAGGGVRLGSSNNNFHIRGSGRVGHTTANLDGSLSLQSGGNAGAGGQVNVGISAADADVTIGLTIGGEEYNLTAGASAGAGLYGEAELNPTTGKDPAVGLGVGPFSFRVSKKRKSSGKAR